MSAYQQDWDCCGDSTITEAWIPEQCPFCELLLVKRQSADLLEALEESDKTLCVLQANIAHANKINSRWDGVWDEIEKIRQINAAAIAKAKGETK